MGLLDGKVAVITGAGAGIGRADALLFAKEGAKVVVNDLGGARDGSGEASSRPAEEVVEEIKATGGEATPNFDNVSEHDGAENIIKTAIDAYGKLDILVNNAGILRDKTLLKMTDDMFDLVVKVHLRGTFLCTRAACAHLRERNEGGRIITTTSVAGLMGNFGQANYASAKAGIYGLTRTVSMEMKKYKVTVNSLAPIAHTRLTSDLPMMQAMPNAKDLLAPEHIAPATLFLASDLASDISGQVLAVEGPRMYLFRMTQTEGVMPKGDGGWSAEEIRERWAEISGK